MPKVSQNEQQTNENDRRKKATTSCAIRIFRFEEQRAFSSLEMAMALAMRRPLLARTRPTRLAI
jgi:hypothetical protein